MAEQETIRVGVETGDSEQKIRRMANEIDNLHRKVERLTSVNDKFKAFNAAIERSARSSDILRMNVQGLTFTYHFFATAIATSVLYLNKFIATLSKIQGFRSSISVSLGGDPAQAAKEYEFLAFTANKYGLELENLVENYGRLMASIPEVSDKLQLSRDVFTGLSMASRALHSSGMDVRLMFYAVTQMASKGTLSMEELRRQLGEKLPGAMEIAARATGYTTKQLEDLIRKGVVDSIKFLRLFGPELMRTFAEAAQMASQSVDGALARLKNVWMQFAEAILSSGAGQSIINVFDALREKLSDPYVISVFASTIKDVGDRLTTFIKNLTADDVRNAFVTAANAVELLTRAFGLLIDAMSWLIKNAPTVAPLIGAAVGAVKFGQIGSAFGPKGALLGGLAGAVVGGAGGWWLGNKIEGGTNTENISSWAEQQAQRLNEEQSQRALALSRVLEHGYGITDKSKYMGLFTPERMMSQNTLVDVSKLLQDKRFKTPDQRLDALKYLADYGVVGPGERPKSPQDIFKDSNKGKEDRAARRLAIREQEYINNLQEKTSRLQGEPTELDKVLGDLRSGKIADFSDAAKIKIVELAQKYDELSVSISKARTANKEFDKALELDKNLIAQNELQIQKLTQETEEYKLSKLNTPEAMIEQTLLPLERERAATIAKIRDDMLDIRDPTYLQILQAREQDINKTYEKRLELLRKQAEEKAKEKFDPYAGASKGLRDLTNEMQQQGELAKNTFVAIFNSMEDAIINFVKTGELSIKSLVQTILMEIAKVQIKQALVGIANVIGLDSIIASLTRGFGTSGGYFGGIKQRAIGGNVFPGEPYIVGERGPELIVPRTAAYVVPNHQLGGKSVQITQNITVGSGVSRSDVINAMAVAKEQAKREVYESMRRGGVFA